MSGLKHHVVAAMDAHTLTIVERKNSYPNAKVDALLAGAISLSPGTFTERDFVALALAALDQAGVSASLQRRINELVADEIEDSQLHVQPCTVVNGGPCYGCELMNAKAVR